MIRSYDAPLALAEDGRTVTGRIFPFGEVAHIREMVGGVLDEYDETFLPGCTARIRQAAVKMGGPKWVRFTVDHEQGSDYRFGYCSELTEAEDGAHATFKLYEPKVALARAMLGESHTGLSIEFDDHAPPRVDGNLRQRRQIDLFAVTATPIPVYASAQVLSMRGEASPLAAAGTPNLDQVRAMLAQA